MAALLNDLAAVIRPADDVVRAWPIPPGVSPEEYARGETRPVRSAGVVVAGRRPLFVPHALSAYPGPNPDYFHAVPLDVADCFPTIEHTGLLADLARHVADPDVLGLVGRAVAAGGGSAGRLW